MSSSDDDIPLGERKVLQKVTEPNDGKPSAATKHAAVAENASSDSDDDVPLAHKQIPKKEPAANPAPGSAKKAAAGSDKEPKAAKKSKTKPKPKTTPAASKASGSKGASSGTERVRKVYDMPGQTRETPPEEDPLRRFYTSLSQQRPGSEMARRWCAMTGLLSREDAEAWVAEQAKKKGSRSPRKPAARRPASASGKRKAVADEDDFKSAKRGKKTPQGKKDAAKAKGSSEKKAKKKAESEEEWDSESDGDEEVLPQKKQRGETKANGSAAADGKKTPASGAPKPKSVRDVAFVDGGMDGSDSDDDVPLLQRVKA